MVLLNYLPLRITCKDKNGMKTKNVYLLAVAAILIGLSSCSKENITFQDAKFKEALLGIDGIDADKNGEISFTEAAAYKGAIDVSGKEGQISEIANLSGIEYFTGITELGCSFTKISSLDVSKNIALTELYCRKTSISSLDVSKNLALTILNCAATNISSLDLSQNTALLSLICFHTKLSSLDISRNIALNLINCSETSISSLDVSQNTKLNNLLCDNTSISSLDVSKSVDLNMLFCSHTNISSLDLTKNMALGRLYCSNTPEMCIKIAEQNTTDWKKDADDKYYVEGENCP